MINSMVYDVEIPDGTIKEYVANIIAENIILQTDNDGYMSLFMECIVGHRKNAAIVKNKRDRFVVTKRGNQDHYRLEAPYWI